MDSSPAFLSLRCRDAEWLDRGDVVGSFAKPVAVDKQREQLAAAELLIADHHARRRLGLAVAGRPIVTCETPRFGIAAAYERREAAISQWTHLDEVAGDILVPDRSGGRPRARGLQMRIGRCVAALAAVVPMLTATISEAAPPTLPAETTTEAPTMAEPPAPTIVVPAPTIVVAPPSAVVPPADSLSLTGGKLWDGLADKPVILVLNDGTELTGIVVAHSNRDLALARASDGTVVSVAKSDVLGIRVPAANAPVAKGGVLESGSGLRAGAGVVLFFGSAAALAGTVMLAIYPSGIYISLPLLLPGLAMIGGGSAMAVSAAKKKKAYEKAWGMTAGRRRVMPTFAAGRSGGQVGLVLRF